MARTASDFLVERLHAWGVRRIFGYPGDGINGVIGALGRATDKIEFVQVRHEETAALMACAHAKFTGQVGVCMATSGPGAIHLLNGLYDAKMDHQPVVALVGQQATVSLGADFQQEVDLVSAFKDVASHYVQLAATPAQFRHLIDRAMRIAIAERTVTCLLLPNDVQEMDAVEVPPGRHGVSYTGIGYSEPYIIPTEIDLHAAARVLNDGERVAMLVGAGVAKALLGKAVLPDDLPYLTGPIGLLGSKPSWDLMMECDTLFMVGSSFPYAEFLPKLGQARGVQIDISSRQLSLRYPMEVNLHGQSRHTLQLLIPQLKRKQDRAWREQIEERVRQWWLVLEARAMNEADPKFIGSQELPNFPYARHAELIGLRGVEMRTPDDVAPGWDQAFNEDRPVVVEAHTDPEVPPLPPHITFDQAKSLTKALFKGDEDTWDILRRTANEVIDGLLPHRR